MSHLSEEAAGINMLKELQATETVARSLLADNDKQKRLFLLDRRLYRVTAERITDPAEIEAATRQMFGCRG